MIFNQASDNNFVKYFISVFVSKWKIINVPMTTKLYEKLLVKHGRYIIV